MEIPYYASADRNKEAIGDALDQYLTLASSVIEIGSGSGQHAVYLSDRFKHLQWQVTEQREYLAGLSAAIAQFGGSNIQPPFELEASSYVATGDKAYSFGYSSNIAHIMGVEQVAATFKVLSSCLAADGLFALYGPFKENGQHNSEGNLEFDQSLRSENPAMGIRDIAEVEGFAQSAGMRLQQQIAMPSNNRILLWQKATNRVQ